MKLDLASLKNRTAWDAAGVKLPEFDIPAVIENTKARRLGYTSALETSSAAMSRICKTTCSIKVLLPRA